MEEKRKREREKERVENAWDKRGLKSSTPLLEGY